MSSRRHKQLSPPLFSRSLREKHFQQQVLDLARMYGWLAFHDYDSRMNARGFLDTVLLKPGRLIFAELKSETGTLRPEQKQWMQWLATCPCVEVYLWRPGDFDSIVATLQS